MGADAAVGGQVDVGGWMDDVARRVEAQTALLTQLDAAIGDGDHGVNMNRGFQAAAQALRGRDCDGPGELLVVAGNTLISAVGGASGALWGSGLRAAGHAVAGRAALDGAALALALETALAAVADLGAAVPGDKTMLDALGPAARALGAAVEAGDGLAAAVDAAAAAAEVGAQATVPMQARKGRASYLGERSIGHEDPGARSTVFIVAALGRALTPGR